VRILLTWQGIHVRLVAAMTAALPTFALPAAAQDYPKQLHELELADYLDIKRRSECGYGYKEC
jgi:hypothetical protein